ncbi:hypothetical protein O3M35_007277 [Rhynocoris fuscipes]|uniref:Uncharacterized protein n=1 Tax=Rhynocoris fuscipes TaxID=488301 RepID=A0AAW1DAG8_9HEMI
MSKKFDVCRGVNTSPTGGAYAYDNPGLLLDNGSYHHGDPDSQQKKRERNSFCTLTLEALPTVDSYSNNKDSVKRPSLGELQGEPAYIKQVTITFALTINYNKITFRKPYQIISEKY